MKGKFDITPAELLADRQGSAKRRSAVNDLENVKQDDPETWEKIESQVAALLPAHCPTHVLDDFVGFIGGMRCARIASAQTDRSVPEVLEDIRQKLLRILPPWLAHLEANLDVYGDDDGFGFREIYRHPEILAEIYRLKRLLAVAREHPRVFRERPRVHPDRPDPDQMFLLFEDYRRAFPKGPHGRPTGISKDGPANTFIVDAIKLIGYPPMTSGAVEIMLRRAQRRYREMTRPSLLKPYESGVTNL